MKTKYEVTAPFRARTNRGIRVFKAGSVVVLTEEMARRLLEAGKVKPLPLPYLDKDGSLVIPFNSDPRYHWWGGGQSVQDTKEEVRGWKH